jgi:hypothetical protein
MAASVRPPRNHFVGVSAGLLTIREGRALADGVEDNVLRHLSEGERGILFELLQKVARLRHA